tara:strand:- start:36 stop:521 length:486 start_codon:yes stop_codon:yes gene_type:complete
MKEYKETKHLYDRYRLESQAEDLLENNKDAVHMLQNILREYKEGMEHKTVELKQNIDALIMQLEDTIQKAIPSNCHDFIEVTWRKRNQTARRDNMIHVAEHKDARWTLCRQSLDHPDIPRSGLFKREEGFGASSIRCTTCIERSDGWFLEPDEEDELTQLG